jgi:hypothetical protein
MAVRSDEPQTPRECAALMLSHVCEAYRRAMAGGHGAAASLEKGRRLLTEMLRQAHEDPDRHPSDPTDFEPATPPSTPIRVADEPLRDLGTLTEALKLAVLLAQELRTTIWTYEASQATRALRQQMGIMLVQAIKLHERPNTRPPTAGRIGLLTTKAGGH